MRRKAAIKRYGKKTVEVVEYIAQVMQPTIGLYPPISRDELAEFINKKFKIRIRK